MEIIEIKQKDELAENKIRAIETMDISKKEFDKDLMDAILETLKFKYISANAETT